MSNAEFNEAQFEEEIKDLRKDNARMLKEAWLDGFEYGVDVACDLGREARRERLEHWGESKTFAAIDEAMGEES